MMPVAEPSHNAPPMDSVDYKKKYTTLKRKLRFLLYEHECFLEELRKSQRKLLKVSKDKSFLLDRLLQYERVDSSSSDSDATASSESEGEGPKDGTATKKKKPSSLLQPSASVMGESSSSSLLSNMGFASMIQAQTKSVVTAVPKTGEPVKKKTKVAKRSSKTVAASASLLTAAHSMLAVSARPTLDIRPPGQMTREELERHLDMKQSSKPQFMSLEKAPNSLPDDIFSNDNSNPGGMEKD